MQISLNATNRGPPSESYKEDIMKFNADELLRDADLWDNRELGASREHVKQASPEKMAAINKTLSMQAISIRLNQNLISDLKDIASSYGIGYQPMIRDLLKKFVVAEKKIQLQKELERLSNEENDINEGSFPIDISFSELKKQA